MPALLRPLVLSLALCLAVASPASAGTDTATAAAGGGSSSSLPRPATELALALPEGVSVANDGSYLIADKGNNRIVRVRPDGVAVLAAGGGTDATSNNISATSANVHWPTDVAATPDGGFLYVENRRNRVRKVDANGFVRTVAGGKDTNEGDGGPATAAGLYYPWSVAVMPDGGFVVSQPYSFRVRRVMPDGTIRTILGDGFEHYPDNVPGTQSSTKWPYGLAVQRDGSVLVAEDYGARIRRVRPDGVVVAFAGSGTDMGSGISQGGEDGKPATQVGLGRLCDVAVAPDDSVIVAQGDCAEAPYTANDRYYLLGRITPDGRYRVFAGNGYGASYQVEGKHRRDIPLGRVRGLAFTRGGDLLHTENSYWRAWRIDSDLASADTTEPQLAITAPSANARFGGKEETVLATATASDASGVESVTFTYRHVGGAGAHTDTTAPYEAWFTAKNLASGPASIEAVARDKVGNVTRRTVSFALDNTAPTLTATGGVAEGAWHGQGAATLRFAAGGADVLRCAAHPDGATAQLGGCTASDRHAFTPANDGWWNFRLRAADDLGNETTLTRRFRVDATAPVVQVSSAAAKWVAPGTVVQITGTGSDANLAKWECRGPGIDWSTCADRTLTDDNRTEGEHVWQFRATDQAGNVTTATRSWIVDGSAPTVAIAGGPAEGATAAVGEIRFDVDARDAHSGVKRVTCSWDGGPYGDCGPRTLGAGGHSFRARVEDNRGLTAEAVRGFALAERDDRPVEPDGGPVIDEPTGPDGGGDIGGDGPDPGDGPEADRIAPVLTVTAPRSVRAPALTKGLRVQIACSETCRGTATLSGPGGLRRAVAVSDAGQVRLRVPAAAVKRALRGGRAQLKLTVRVADAAGNATTRTTSIVLRR